MQKILYIIGTMAVAYPAHAQTSISLTKANITGLSPGSVHTVKAGTSGFKAPKTGANQAWDYSALSSSATINANLVSASQFSKSFSKTAVIDTSLFETVIKATQEIKAGIVYDIDSNGFFMAGRYIPKQNYSEAPLTGNPKDSSYWPEQSYLTRENTIEFPMTMGSSWTTTHMHPLNSFITVVAFNLNMATVGVIVHTNIKDSVVGWGTLKIPAGSKPSIPYNVLLVRRHTVSTDSFYLNGQPAPPFILAGFGSNQNDTSQNMYQELFYRKGTGMPLMSVNYNADSTYSNPYAISYDQDSVISKIKNQDNTTGFFKIYPNPASGGNVNIQLYKESVRPWKLTVLNSLGASVKTLELNGTGNLSSVIDMSNCGSGLYFVHITDQQGNMLISSKMDILH